jgi:hypothetical protein
VRSKASTSSGRSRAIPRERGTKTPGLLRPKPRGDLLDSRFLGFFVRQKLKTIDVAGGPPTTLCDLPVAGAGGTWSRDGVILFSAGVAPLQKVSASGGVPGGRHLAREG